MNNILQMVYTNLSDQELWQYCRKDDVKAYTELFERYAGKLYKHSIGYIKDTATTEELVMDLLFSFWQKREQLSIEGDFAAYLFRSMRNQVLKHLRKNIPLTESVDLIGEHELVESRQADYNLLVADTQFQYRQKLDKLSPQRRKVFLLSREENLSYAEIAKEMNISVNTVENYMVAALSSFRRNSEAFTALMPLMLSLVL